MQNETINKGKVALSKHLTEKFNLEIAIAEKVTEETSEFFLNMIADYIRNQNMAGLAEMFSEENKYDMDSFEVKNFGSSLANNLKNDVPELTENQDEIGKASVLFILNFYKQEVMEPGTSFNVNSLLGTVIDKFKDEEGTIGKVAKMADMMEVDKMDFQGMISKIIK